MGACSRKAPKPSARHAGWLPRRLERELDEVLGHSLGKDHRLEQAVGCQSVGSMHTGAGHLADGVEVWHGFSGALQESSPDVIHTNASNHVMGSGNHRNRIASELKPFLGQTASDGGEFFLPWKIKMRGDQIDAGCPVLLHLLVNGACHDVPCRQ